MGRLIRKLEEMVSGTGEIVYSLLFGRQQARFIRRQLSNSSSARIGRVIVSVSTLPDRIDNLEPTLRCLLEQTRTPDEIESPNQSRSLRALQVILFSRSSSIPRCGITPARQKVRSTWTTSGLVAAWIDVASKSMSYRRQR
jgi:hypothetical protein